MDWHNLKEFSCPYCSHPLEKDEDGEIKCSKCLFHIDEERYRKILSHRSGENTEGTRMKWQHLKDDNCPKCGNTLRYKNGGTTLLECSSTECDFRIKEQRMQEILDDVNHPANKFYRKSYVI